MNKYQEKIIEKMSHLNYSSEMFPHCENKIEEIYKKFKRNYLVKPANIIIHRTKWLVNDKLQLFIQDTPFESSVPKTYLYINADGIFVSKDHDDIQIKIFNKFFTETFDIETRLLVWIKRYYQMKNHYWKGEFNKKDKLNNLRNKIIKESEEYSGNNEKIIYYIKLFKKLGGNYE